LTISRSTFAVTLGILAIAASGCRGRTYRTYGFQPGVGRLATGGEVSLLAEGRSVPYDSAGVLIDRTGSPYWIGVYVRGRQGRDLKAARIQFTGAESGRVTSPALSPPEALDDSATLIATADGVDLPFEDQTVLIHFEGEAGRGAAVDSARVVIRKKFEERRVSFLEWLSHI